MSGRVNPMRNALIGGILAGLLTGGAAAVAVWKLPKSEPAAKAETPKVDPAAKALADGLVAKRRARDLKGLAEATGEKVVPVSTATLNRLAANMVMHHKLMETTLGKPTGEVELIREEAATPAVARLVYLEKFEKGAFVWTFVLYQATDGWRIASVYWNQNLGALFDGAGDEP